MIKDAATLLKENYHKLGNLTDAQFIATKSKVCGRRMIHAERIGKVVRVNDFGTEETIRIPQIQVGDTVKVTATVRSMNVNGGSEKTGAVTLDNIQDVFCDESTGILFIDTEKCIFTTIECGIEWSVLNEVIRRPDNWVNQYVLSEMIGSNSLLTDFQAVRDGQNREFELDFDDIGFEEKTNNSPTFSDLLF